MDLVALLLDGENKPFGWFIMKASFILHVLK